MLVPHVCTELNEANTTIDRQYKDLRGDVAMTDRERTLLINATGQPCSQFAIHDALPVLHDLYNDEELLFLANTGVINTAQMNRFNFDAVTKTRLFAHNHMSQECKTVDPYAGVPGTGVLGRMAQALGSTEVGYSPNMISIDNDDVSVIPSTGTNVKPMIISRYGVTEFYTRVPNDAARVASIADYVNHLNNHTSAFSNFYGDAWSETFVNGASQAKVLKAALDTTVLDTRFSGNDLAVMLEMICRLQQTKTIRGADRDLFFTEFGGWDTHGEMKPQIGLLFRYLNDALTSLVTQLKAQGTWDDTVIVVSSEFGRTLTPNGNAGTDHAWGGNYFLLGGAVKGKRILGKYPSDLSEATSSVLIGRGRVMPTTSWDAIWNGIAEWMDVPADKMDFVLPNRHKVVGGMFTDLFTKEDLFQQVAQGRRERRLRGGGRNEEQP